MIESSLRLRSEQINSLRCVVRIRSAFGSFVQCSSCKSGIRRTQGCSFHFWNWEKQPFFDWMRIAMTSQDASKPKICGKSAAIMKICELLLKIAEFAWFCDKFSEHRITKSWRDWLDATPPTPAWQLVTPYSRCCSSVPWGLNDKKKRRRDVFSRPKMISETKLPQLPPQTQPPLPKLADSSDSQTQSRPATTNIIVS